MSAVILNKIHKTFNKGELLAVNTVSFEVNEGELFAWIS